MSWEHAAEARAALNAIVNDPEHGVSALSSAQTMSNLLKDLLPDAPREKSILVAAAEAGLAGTLRDHVNQGMDPATAIRLTASTFSASTPFTPDACNWVTGEIAGALGISQPGSPGGAFGGSPGAFGSGGAQGAPTQMAPIPGYTPGQPSTQGPGAFGGQGGGFGGQGAFDPGATAPGSWQGGQAAGGFGQGTGQPAGGFGQGTGGAGQPAGGFGQGTGQAAGGFGQGTGQPASGFGQGTGAAAGQPTTAWQPGQPGFGAAGTGGAQPGWQPAQQQGFGQPGQPGQPGTPGGWQPAGGGFGPPQRSRRGLFIGLGVVAVIIVAIVIATSLGGGKKTPTPQPTTPIAGHSSPVVTSPATSPVSTPPPGAIEPLATIMNDPGHPVGTKCEDNPPLFGLNASTVIARRFCAKTDVTNVIVWGYQFDSAATYQTAVSHIKSFTGFNNETPSKGCPPPSGDSEGTIGWHALHNARYKSRPGQELDCFMNGTKPRPTLIWTMPGQHVFFIAKDTSATSSLDTIIKWWDDVAYAP